MTERNYDAKTEGWNICSAAYHGCDLCKVKEVFKARCSQGGSCDGYLHRQELSYLAQREQEGVTQ
jgi:hypothetical protein